MSVLRTLAGRIDDVLCAVSALQWDARVVMPPGGAETRGRQIATLEGKACGDDGQGRLRDTFAEQLGDVSEQEWLAAITTARPGLIRVEADELTYDLHIMLRVRIGMALLDGMLQVADVPDAWAERMQADLGLTVPDDAQGCLQDVHWPHNYFGSFPTYTIGNLTAVRLFARLQREPAVWRGGSRNALGVRPVTCPARTAPQAQSAVDNALVRLKTVNSWQ